MRKRRRSLEKLAICSVLIGTSIVIGMICRAYLTFGGVIRITFENLPIILTGIICGPILGTLAGVGADLISSVATGQAINPVITLGCGIIGLIAGLAYKIPVNRNARLVICEALSQITGSVVVKSVGLYAWYRDVYSPLAFIGMRSGTYLVIVVVEAALLVVLSKTSFIKEWLD